MITLSNGHKFEYMASSGALGFDGKGWLWERPWRWIGLLDPSLFTVVTKTLTRYSRKGNLRWRNPFECVRFLRGGVANAVGLTNPGVGWWWCKKVGPGIDSSEISVVASIAGKPLELAEMAEMLNDFDLVGLEINPSCPNIEECLADNAQQTAQSLQWVKRISRFPIILKLSIAQDIEVIARQADGLAEAFSINSVPWPIIFPNRPSPFARLGTDGAVSGKIAQKYTWYLAQRLSRASKIPVIWPGVWDYEDMLMLCSFGAKAISFGSVFSHYPWRPTFFVRKRLKATQFARALA